MEYKVVWNLNEDYGKALEDIAKDVKLLCYHDWKPQGGISVTQGEIYYYVCQAIVRE